MNARVAFSVSPMTPQRRKKRWVCSVHHVASAYPWYQLSSSPTSRSYIVPPPRIQADNEIRPDIVSFSFTRVVCADIRKDFGVSDIAQSYFLLREATDSLNLPHISLRDVESAVLHRTTHRHRNYRPRPKPERWRYRWRCRYSLPSMSQALLLHSDIN